MDPGSCAQPAMIMTSNTIKPSEKDRFLCTVCASCYTPPPRKRSSYLRTFLNFCQEKTPYKKLKGRGVTWDTSTLISPAFRGRFSWRKEGILDTFPALYLLHRDPLGVLVDPGPFDPGQYADDGTHEHYHRSTDDGQ